MVTDIEMIYPELIQLDRIVKEDDVWVVGGEVRVTFEKDGEVLLDFGILEGFYFDFASVPRVARGFYPSVGKKTDLPALIHDFLYATELVDRKMADDLFHIAMQHMGVPRFKRDTMHAAVRAGGWATWSNHTEEGVLMSRLLVSDDLTINKDIYKIIDI